MAIGDISTSTVAWYNKTFVTATGSPSAVATELAIGASSNASLQSSEDILCYNTYWNSVSLATLCHATYVVDRNLAGWVA